jgi:hypothetical protein
MFSLEQVKFYLKPLENSPIWTLLFNENFKIENWEITYQKIFGDTDETFYALYNFLQGKRWASAAQRKTNNIYFFL